MLAITREDRMGLYIFKFTDSLYISPRMAIAPKATGAIYDIIGNSH